MRFALVVLAACSTRANQPAPAYQAQATCPGTAGDFLMITARNETRLPLDVCKLTDEALVRAGASRTTLQGSELTVIAVRTQRKDSVMCLVRIELHEHRRLVRAETGIGDAPPTDDALRDASTCISGTLFRLLQRPAKPGVSSP